MNSCRTCLSRSVEKDITQLEKELKSNKTRYPDVMLFCLDIKVSPESKLTTKLCIKCYRNIISFYKFKTRAIENDVILKELNKHEKDNDSDLSFGLETVHIDHISEEIHKPDGINNMDEPEKKKCECKNKHNIEKIQSEYELFNDIQKITYKYVPEPDEQDDWNGDSVPNQSQSDPRDVQFAAYASVPGHPVCAKEPLDLQDSDFEGYSFLLKEEQPLYCYRIRNLKSNEKSLNGHVRGLCALLRVDKKNRGKPVKIS